MHQLLECLSLALNLSSHDSLVKHHARSLFNLDLIHYPALSARLLRSGEIVRNPAHSDFGSLTLLFQDDTGGLEVADMSSTKIETSAELEKTGIFRHIDPEPGTIVVNVGYLLMRWSNGRWKNTVHRVSEPSRKWKELHSQNSSFCESPKSDDGGAEEMIPERYSIAFFGNPDPETTVEALPGCWDKEVPKKWNSINAGEYLCRKRKRAYGQT
jgi:isopenicillin N synthase-like dioxygenase